MQIPRHDMPEQPAAERATNFVEVNLGFDAATAIAEAERCLLCKRPTCIEGCPVNINVKDFVAAVAGRSAPEGTD